MRRILMQTHDICLIPNKKKKHFTRFIIRNAFIIRIFLICKDTSICGYHNENNLTENFIRDTAH